MPNTLYVFTCGIFFTAGMVFADGWHHSEILENRKIMDQYEESITRMCKERYEDNLRVE